MTAVASVRTHPSRTQADTFRGLLQLIAVSEPAPSHRHTHERRMGHQRRCLWRGVM